MHPPLLAAPCPRPLAPAPAHAPAPGTRARTAEPSTPAAAAAPLTLRPRLRPRRRHGCLKYISQLRALASLTLDPELVLRHDQLGLLAGLSALTHLSINLAPADGSLHAAPELAGLAALSPLRHLELCTAISGRSLQQLAALTQLTRLDLAIRAMQVGPAGCGPGLLAGAAGPGWRTLSLLVHPSAGQWLANQLHLPPPRR